MSYINTCVIIVQRWCLKRAVENLTVHLLPALGVALVLKDSDEREGVTVLAYISSDSFL